MIYMLICIFVGNGEAQKLSQHQNGHLILTYEDGSWRYFDQTDSVLLKSKLHELLANQKQSSTPKVLPNQAQEGRGPTTDGTTKEVSNLEPKIRDSKELQLARDALSLRKNMLDQRKRRFESGAIALSKKEVKRLYLDILEVQVAIGDTDSIHHESTDREVSQSSIEVEEETTAAARRIEPEQEHGREQYRFELEKDVSRKFPCSFQKSEEDQILKTSRERYFVATDGANDASTQHTEAFATFVRSGEVNRLELLLHIDDENSESNRLARGGALIITFISGDELQLNNATASYRRKNKTENYWVYSCNFILDRSAEKKMARNDVDNIVIHWEAGPKEYQIYQLDLLRQLLGCLLNK